MTSIDVFYNREYLFGNVYSYHNTEVISSINPDKLFFAADTEKPKSGGCCVRFMTDSPEVKIVYSITTPINGNFPHVGISAQRGLSCSYRRINETYWRNIDCFNNRGNTGEIQIQSDRWVARTEWYELAVFLPINCFITQLEIFIDEGANISSCKDMSQRKIMILGGEVSYGMGITSTQFLLSNLLTRHIPGSDVKNIAFYRRDTWSAYEEVLSLLSELGQQELLLLEIPYSQGNMTEWKELVFRVLAVLCEKVKGRIVLWYKPCFERLYSMWAPLFEQFIADQRRSSKMIFDRSFLLKNNTEYDMYMSSGKFVNDNGNIYIMKQFLKLTEDLWNT